MSVDPEFITQPSGPLLIVVSGLSGAGKDTVVQRMQERGLPFHFVVTATTRAPRPGETNGKDYWFVSREEFERMLAQNELLEHAIVYGDHKGVPRAEVQGALATGKDVVMRLDVQGAETVHRLIPDALLIFITTPSEEELVQRLNARETETPESLAVRVATAREELKHVGAFDYVIVNRDLCLDDTVDTVRAIIEAEHHRVRPRKVNL